VTMPSTIPGYHLEQLADGQWVLVNDATGDVVVTDPFSPTDPATRPSVPGSTQPTIGGNPINSGAAGGGGGTAAFDLSGLKWLASLVLLWLILTALSEYSPNTKMLGQALAGLILLGALFYLGPGAISNVKNLWTQTGASPVQGPQPVQGG
jgi:hypothetical protein